MLRAEGVSPDGAVAWCEGTVESRRPFYLEPKLPQEVTAGDRIDLPVAVVSGVDGAGEATILPTVMPGALTLGAFSPKQRLAPGGRGRVILPLDVRPVSGAFDLRLTGMLQSGGQTYSDDMSRTIRIVPRGFPIEHAWGGRVGPDAPLVGRVSIPKGSRPAASRPRRSSTRRPWAS